MKYIQNVIKIKFLIIEATSYPAEGHQQILQKRRKYAKAKRTVYSVRKIVFEKINALFLNREEFDPIQEK